MSLARRFPRSVTARWAGSALALLIGGALVGCSTTQSTSGAAWLAEGAARPATLPPTPGLAGAAPLSVDEQVRAAAAVEPTLHFPARLGIAYLNDGHLSAIPPEDWNGWDDLRNHLDRRFGEIEPIDPLVAETVAQTVGPAQSDPLAEALRKIRVGAARQHLDAVMIYETQVRSDREGSALQLLNLTVIGYFVLPSTSTHANAFAAATLIDVRNGYRYASLGGKGNESGFSPTNTASDAQRTQSDKARRQAVTDLIAQVEPTLTRLDRDLWAAQHPTKN